jgi:hypothetical protein
MASAPPLNLKKISACQHGESKRGPHIHRAKYFPLGAVWLALSLLIVAVLAACGGGGPSSSSSQPPPGSVVNNVCSQGSGYSPVSPSGAQPNPFFGMHIHSLEPATPWPNTVSLSNYDVDGAVVEFGGIRFWDSGVSWGETNSAAGTCDFSHLDSFMQEAQSNNVDVLYNLGRTPTWASSQPTNTNCSYSSSSEGGPGQCAPPSDLNSDGSGPDAIWIGWVTSVVTRYKGQIKFYEIWNEWNISLFWIGTPQQLVRMTQDARCVIEGPPVGATCNPNSTFPNGTGIDPSAKISTPAPVGAQTVLNAVQTNMSNFFGTQVNGEGPAGFVDIVGFHCYVSTQTPGDYPVPEDVLTVISDLEPVLPNYNLQSAPLFCTEGSWGQAPVENFLDPDLQQAFLARYFLLQNWQNISRVYWYAWDATESDMGALWSPGDPTQAATAYAEVYKWITGNTPTGCSIVSGTTQYECGYTNGNGYLALAVWDSNVSGNGTPGGSSCYTAGTPTCSTFTIPSGYTMYRDLYGNETPVSGSIGISAKPILLENGPLP